MPAKSDAELTKHELGILGIAAVFQAIIQHVWDHPPAPTQRSLFDVKVREELVSTVG
jgi:hypothetical protein